ncbi:MAG: hypothetical protein IIZ12_04215 [Eggerthellaceae bacterium]|nr:hypothetical protein [Eggerthellaceae bacterium]
MRQLDGQLTFDLFERGTPTWEDVQKGRAELIDTIEPCDRCMMFWHGGRCTSTPENFAFPKQRPNGMCAKRRIVWKDS